MIAVIQFDAASMASMERLLAQGALPAFADLRRRGVWFDLETPTRDFEGAGHLSPTSAFVLIPSALLLATDVAGNPGERLKLVSSGSPAWAT